MLDQCGSGCPVRISAGFSIGTIFQVRPQIKANCMMVQLRGEHGCGSREPQCYDWMQLRQRGPEQPPDRSNQCRGLVGLRLDPIMLS